MSDTLQPDDPGQRLEDLLAEHRDPEPDTADDTADADPAFDSFAPLPGDAPPNAGSEQGEQEAGDDDADDLPEAPLFALLRTIEREVEPERIDRIWVFPPRRLEAGETAVVVVAAYPDVDADRRRVYAAHYTLQADVDEPRLALDEFGTAPTDRVGRLVEEVVERIKDGPAAAPRSHRIEGKADLWNAALHTIAEAWLAEAARNPRLR